MIIDSNKLLERSASFNKTTLMFVVIGGLASALTVNAPSILMGYGLINVVMLLAAWQYRPRMAGVLVLVAMLIALPFYLIPSSIFVSLAVLSVVLIPVLAYLAALVNARYGRFASAVALSVFETLIVLSISILDFGTADAGLAIFGTLLAPFTYAIFVYSKEKGLTRALGTVASVVSLLVYYFSFYAYAVYSTGLLAVLSLSILLAVRRRPNVGASRGSIYAIPLVLSVAGLFLGGSQLSYNMSTSLYPFEPHSWTSLKWEQQNPGVCPATNDVFGGTWSPARFRIVNTCTTAAGVVGQLVTAENDGDFSFNIKVNQTYSGLLSLANYLFEGGELHVEVVPADQHRILDPIGGGVCPGDLVKVTGVLVLDTDHGMGSELHPAASITIINHATSVAWPGCILGQPVNG